MTLPNLYPHLAALLSPPTPTPAPSWIAVTPRFREFHENIQLTELQLADGMVKFRGVVNCLNRAYWDSSSETEHGIRIGSWGKGTATRPPRDVDLMFVLPVEVYERFQGNAGNRQSALLQEVKAWLSKTNPDTEMRGDGQVVVVRFGSYGVEVAPAFSLKDGRYFICDTNDGGKYKTVDPVAERQHIETCDTLCSNNLRPLIQMLKAWQRECNVPIKSFQLELVAADFLMQSPWRNKGYFYYDWIIRDFFSYLQGRARGSVYMPGTYEPIYLGDEWLSRAETAYGRALKACTYEQLNYVTLAGDEWQKIFGTDIPGLP